MSTPGEPTIDPIALAALRCPASGQALVQGERAGAPVLMTSDGAHAYPIVGGVPVLLRGADLGAASGTNSGKE